MLSVKIIDTERKLAVTNGEEGQLKGRGLRGTN